jgi:hypothetical protein
MALNRTALSVTLAAALLGVVPPDAAQSAPAAWLPRPFPKSDVLLVAQGCGPGLHRDRYGYCVPNGPVVLPPACPPGYRLGPYGRRCVPVGYYPPPPPGYGPPPGPPPGGLPPPPPGGCASPRTRNGSTSTTSKQVSGNCLASSLVIRLAAVCFEIKRHGRPWTNKNIICCPPLVGERPYSFDVQNRFRLGMG